MQPKMPADRPLGPPPPMRNGPVTVSQGMDMRALALVYAHVYAADFAKFKDDESSREVAEVAVRHFCSVMVSDR